MSSSIRFTTRHAAAKRDAAAIAEVDAMIEQARSMIALNETICDVVLVCRREAGYDGPTETNNVEKRT